MSIETLAAGERAAMPRTNAASICFALDGQATVSIDGVRRRVGQWDTWTVPSMAAEDYEVDASFAALRFSNAALLASLGANWQSQRSALDATTDGGVRLLDGERSATRPRPVGPPGTVGNDGRVGSFHEDGPFRLEYERLIDPPFVGATSWHWTWTQVRDHLATFRDLDARYAGRRVCLLYDPATGRANGTTFSLFASMAMRPAGIVDSPHRHTAAAVNYFFSGSGWSTVAGQRIEWSSGDLVFVAPAWTAHHHASYDEDVHQLAVQDNPMHLAAGSLLWQESFDDPPKLLGIEPGFTTNRHLLAAQREAGHR